MIHLSILHDILLRVELVEKLTKYENKDIQYVSYFAARDNPWHLLHSVVLGVYE